MMKKIMTLPALLVIAMFGVFVIEVLIPGNLSWLGIRPRSIIGLVGVIVSPLLHADLTHLLVNTLPLFILASFVSALEPSLFVIRSAVLIILSGLLTWLISTFSVVIGASGLVFAYWAFLITNGLLQKRVKDILFAIITLLVYGTLIFSLFQLKDGVSWAGHFSGCAAGIALALLQRRQSSSRFN